MNMLHMIRELAANHPVIVATILFTTSFVNDFVWGTYIIRAGSGNAVGAANAAVGIRLLGSISLVGFLEAPWMIIPMCVGDWLGSWLSVNLDVKRKNATRPVDAL